MDYARGSHSTFHLPSRLHTYADYTHAVLTVCTRLPLYTAHLRGYRTPVAFRHLFGHLPHCYGCALPTPFGLLYTGLPLRTRVADTRYNRTVYARHTGWIALTHYRMRYARQFPHATFTCGSGRTFWFATVTLVYAGLPTFTRFTAQLVTYDFTAFTLPGFCDRTRTAAPVITRLPRLVACRFLFCPTRFWITHGYLVDTYLTYTGYRLRLPYGSRSGCALRRLLRADTRLRGLRAFTLRYHWLRTAVQVTFVVHLPLPFTPQDGLRTRSQFNTFTRYAHFGYATAVYRGGYRFTLRARFGSFAFAFTLHTRFWLDLLPRVYAGSHLWTVTVPTTFTVTHFVTRGYVHYGYRLRLPDYTVTHGYVTRTD